MLSLAFDYPFRATPAPKGFALPLPVPTSPIVFVIDGDLAVLSALAFALEAEGYRVRAFKSPERADQSPDLAKAACIVLDQTLPGECGLDYVDRLRRAGHRTPAILIPSAPSLSTRLTSLDMDITLVEKPLLDDALFQAVRARIGAGAPLAAPTYGLPPG